MQAKFRCCLSSLAVASVLAWTTAADGASGDFDVVELKPLGPQARRLSFGAQFMTTVLPKMTDGKGAVLSAHFGLMERLRVGLQGALLSSDETSFALALRRQGVDLGSPPNGSPLSNLYQLQWMVAADAQFSPMHAQLNLTDHTALNFEFFIPAGIGVGHLRRGRQPTVAPTGELKLTEFDTAFRPVFNLGLGARAYVTPWLALSAEFRELFFSDPSAGLNEVNFRPYLQLGLQFSWGSDAVLPASIARAEAPSFVDQRLELGAQLSAGFYDRLINSVGFSGSVGYHFSKYWQVEAFGTKLFSNRSDLSQEVLGNFSLRSDISKQTELLWAAGLTVQLIPFHGRLNVLGRTIAISPYIGMGAGFGETRVPCDAGMALDPEQFGEDARCPLFPVDAAPNTVVYEPNSLRPVGVLSGGLRLRLADHFALRLEVKDHIHTSRVFRPETNEADRLQSSIRHIVMSQVGLSVLFGGS